jgi:hypothetical protein
MLDLYCGKLIILHSRVPSARPERQLARKAAHKEARNEVALNIEKAFVAPA